MWSAIASRRLNSALRGGCFTFVSTHHLSFNVERHIKGCPRVFDIDPARSTSAHRASRRFPGSEPYKVAGPLIQPKALDLHARTHDFSHSR